jgi:hypothetical protein
MYYGNPTCASQQNKIGVWDSHYVIVQHLNESSDPYEDSTSYNNDGNESGGVTQGTAAKISGGAYLDGVNDLVNFGTGSSLAITDKITVEAWVKTNNYAGDKPLIFKCDDGGHLTYYVWYPIYDDQIEWTTYGTASAYLDYIKTISNGTWYYFVATYDKDGGSYNKKIYFNGAEEKNGTATGSISSQPNEPLILGNYESHYFNGTIDEVRISNIARSAGWINTSYQTMNDPQNFASFGSQVGLLSTWSYQKKITIESDYIDTHLKNFPVLIKTSSDSDLKNHGIAERKAPVEDQLKLFSLMERGNQPLLFFQHL